MKTLEEFKKELLQTMNQKSVLGFKKSFVEFDKVIYDFRAQRKPLDYLQPWYDLYSDLLDIVVKKNMPDFYEIILDGIATPMNTPHVLSPERLKSNINGTFHYLVEHFNEEIMMTFVKHLRKTESRYPEYQSSMSMIPMMQLLTSDLEVAYLSKLFFECEYTPETLIYFFLVPLDEMSKEFYYDNQDKLSMLLHYCDRRVRANMVRGLATTALGVGNPYMYITLVNYLRNHYIENLRPEQLQSEMEKKFNDNKDVQEIIESVRVQ